MIILCDIDGTSAMLQRYAAEGDGPAMALVGAVI